jgi:preprotein translocase subunit SecG
MAGMSWVQTLAVVFHVLLAFAIVALVLLQRGRGADAGAGFGAGASGTVFGARGSASFLSRTTAVLATLFIVSSLALSYVFSHGTEPTSVVDRVKVEEPAPAPTLPQAPLPGQMPVPMPASPAPATAPTPAPATSGNGEAPTAPAQ